MALTIKEIQDGYLTSPYFKDLYLYLAQNKLPSKKSAMCKVENLAERFILLDTLLFKIITTLERETALLVMPEICTDKIITLYHTSLFVGHQGVIKTYLTISDKFFIPGLMHYLRSFIKGSHKCQLTRADKPPTRHKFILCIIDEVTNYLITVPIFQAKSEKSRRSLNRTRYNEILYS